MSIGNCEVLSTRSPKVNLAREAKKAALMPRAISWKWNASPIGSIQISMRLQHKYVERLVFWAVKEDEQRTTIKRVTLESNLKFFWSSPHSGVFSSILIHFDPLLKDTVNTWRSSDQLITASYMLFTSQKFWKKAKLGKHFHCDQLTRLWCGGAREKTGCRCVSGSSWSGSWQGSSLLLQPVSWMPGGFLPPGAGVGRSHCGSHLLVYSLP